MVVTNAKWWDGLPADVRTGLEQAMEQATTYANKMAAELNERDRKLIIAAKKAKVQTLTKDDVAAWRKAMEPVWIKFEGQIGPELRSEERSVGLESGSTCRYRLSQSP